MIPASDVLVSNLEGLSWTIVECFSSGTVSTTSELLDILPATDVKCLEDREKQEEKDARQDQWRREIGE
jgi:hypothetical protein